MIRRLLFAAVAAPLVILGATAGTVYWFLTGDAARGALEREVAEWLGQPVRIGRASVALLPRVSLRLQDVRVGEPVRMTLSEVAVSAPLRALLAGRIEDAALVVSDSRVDLPLPFPLPDSAGQASPAGDTADTGDTVDVVSVRSIALRNLTLASGGREIRISADSSFADTRLVVTSLTATAGQTHLDASGTIDLTPRVDATIEGRASSVDSDDLLALVAAFTAPGGAAAAPGSTPPARVTAHIQSPLGTVAGVAIRRFDATIRADGTQVSIEPLAFDVFGGRHNGWLDAVLGETLDVRIGTSVSNIDVAQLAAFGGIPGAITGRLGASGRFGARGRDMAAVLSSLRGAGEVVVSKGTMRGLDLVRTVVRFLGRAPAEASAGGTPFDRIDANFALGDRLVRTDDLTLHSADFDIFARGTLRLDTEALDGRAEVVLSEALSAQTGREVYRYARTGNRIVLPATVGGTMVRPQVGIDAAAAVKQAVGTEIGRRLADLLDRVRRF